MPRPQKPGRGDLSPPPPTGYPSAYDIPDFKRMREQMRAMQVLLVFKPSMRGEFKQLKAQFERIVSTVERFYELLGERHWVFHGSLNLELLAPALASADADTAEAAVIAHYQDERKMKFHLMRAKAVPELRLRASLLDAALRDYQEGRYYSVVLVLLAVMDGFVNDVGQQRRGLHTRDGEELVAWNSVTAHHQGLAATQKSFTKSFNKTSDEPIHELYRNGIMHGNLTNFDHLVVASKAWNRLFALLDWSQALDEAKKPEPETPTLRESLRKLADSRQRQQQMAAWTPRAASVEEDGSDAVLSEPVAQATAAMLDAWKSKNYGHLAAHLHDFGKPRSASAFIGQVRARFDGTRLDDFDIRSVDVRAPGCAHVKVNLTVEGEVRESELRWLHVDPDRHVCIETDARGKWQTVQTEPLSIIGRSW
ncbi:hypothetical protein [Microbacterium sp.]|uniref:hypothetical protein n=1 Tax=Microbacterium sp. TaxID=51671 RepID=UPI0028124FFD|nr:hypothetical protein [Microbacterium sp.]